VTTIPPNRTPRPDEASSKSAPLATTLPREGALTGFAAPSGGITEPGTATSAPVVDKAKAMGSVRYAPCQEWTEHNPLAPELTNLVACPEALTPALTAQEAARHREDLLVEAGNVECVALARETAKTAAPRNTLEQLLVEQLAAAHRLAMTMIAKSQHFAEHITSWAAKERQQLQSIEAARMAGSAARLMDTFQRGMLTLDRLQNGGRQTVVVQHLQQVQVNDRGQAVVKGTTKSKNRKGGDHKK
jgi:hypothetical protein